jgi:tetratricopeptide (TPR) repeat protein
MRFAPLSSLTAILLTFHVAATGIIPGLQDRGKLIDTIRCKANSKFSYALYLPANYSDASKWPVIFVFDPAARGSLAASCFVNAAAKYGYIIACSNNSKNQLPWNEISDAVNSMFTDVQQKFSINNRRIYTSGFSGGSRVASMIALQNNLITGVIACGAGLPNDGGLDKIPSFSYFGIVGNHDMNYIEMYDLGKKLDSLGINSEIRVFEGGHDWPSPDLLQEAVEWMEIQAMNAGVKEKNTGFINSRLAIKKLNAETLWKKGKLIESVLQYVYIIKDFPGDPSAAKIKETLDSLKKTAEYLKAVKSFNKNRTLELETQSDIVTILYAQIRAEALPDTVRYLLANKIRLLKNMESGKDSSRQVIASRVRMLVSTICYETGKNLLNVKKYKGATISYQVGVMIDPPNKFMLYQLAKAYAYNNETDKSLVSLEKAIRMGIDNRKIIETEPAFVILKNQKRYIELQKLLR